MTLPTDQELLTFSLADPELERHRDFLRNTRVQARQDFIAAHVATMEWSTAMVSEDNPGLNNEAKQNLAAAMQRKENCRSRFAELDRLVGGLPEKPKEPSKVRPIAAEASKG